METSTRRVLDLPAELRLLIWEFVVPKVVRIYGLGGLGLWPQDPRDRRLKLFPALEAQLLLVNKQVYDEVLPFLQRTVILLDDRNSQYESDWLKLKRAWQLPSFGVLHHSLGDGISSDFLPRFITWKATHPTRRLVLDLPHCRQPFIRLYLGIYPCSWIIYAYYAVTVLAGIMLSKGLVSEVQVQVDGASSADLPNWDPEELRSYLLGSSTAKAQARLLDSRADPRFLEHTIFHNDMMDITGATTGSRIHITTTILRTWKDDVGKFSTLRVTYNLID